MFIEEQIIHSEILALVNRQIKCNWREVKVTFLTDGEVTSTFDSSYTNIDTNEELELNIGFELFQPFYKLRRDMIESKLSAWFTATYILSSSGGYTFQYDDTPFNIFEHGLST